MMPPVCTVCTHPKRAEIDAALLAGNTLRNIAERTGTSTTSLHRHRSHIPAALSKAYEVAEVVRADDLLAQVRELQTHALAVLQGAEEEGDGRLALQAIREARGNLELLAKLLGELADGGTTVNILVSPQWAGLQSAIVGALAAYPEARDAVVRALEAGNGH